MKFPGFGTQNLSPVRTMRAFLAGKDWKRAMWLGLFLGVVAVVLAPVAGNGMLQFPHIPPEITRIPDRTDQDKINERQNQQQDLNAMNEARRKQIADESTTLLKLATDLKSEVDKTNKDTLSLNVIRKADAIEKLAHDVKEKMKLSIGSN
jgi:hypothetical protein